MQFYGDVKTESPRATVTGLSDHLRTAFVSMSSPSCTDTTTFKSHENTEGLL